MGKMLEKYQEKRKFEATTEPSGEKGKSPAGNIFVIQKHDASSLHYDFRLRIGDVLKSWAVPKGPSTDPSQKRLAVPTEDHPLQYADFEGIIPEGEYGAGTVMVWDTGKFRNIGEKGLEDSYKEGKIKVWLEGKKLGGGYSLVKTGKNWLLIKMDDEKADARRNPTSTEPLSVKSSRSLKEIKQESKG
ncbi:DNA ligase [Candidatus Micrarchaeota archaeon]|nr:DNA ligase [Candidatus Micrarchaeota archaeon]